MYLVNVFWWVGRVIKERLYDSVKVDIFALAFFHIFEKKLAFTLGFKFTFLGSLQSACYDKSYFRTV